MTQQEKADFARRQHREYVDRTPRTGDCTRHLNTVYRVDGIGPKAVPPTYGKHEPPMPWDDHANLWRGVRYGLWFTALGFAAICAFCWLVRYFVNGA